VTHTYLKNHNNKKNLYSAARVGVQVDYNVVHLRNSLVQLFVLLLQNFEKVVQMIELKSFEGAPNG
jgi:transcriptional antiterminator